MSVDWERLDHAYGSAGDVPESLRALRSADDAARRRAIAHLSGSIAHQGSRYRASAPAVPFLYEALDAPDTPERHEILELLERLAIGYPEERARRGFDPKRAFARADRLERRVDLAALRADYSPDDDDSDIAVQNLWERDAYEAVLARIDIAQRLTDDADRAVRLGAVRLLAWFPAAAEMSMPLVRAAARTRPEPDERAHAIHALALLGRCRRDRSDAPWLRTQMAPEHPYLVRIVAAFALAILRRRALSDAAQDLLWETLLSPEKARAAGANGLWFWSGLRAEAVACVGRAKPERKASLLPALCEAAERVENTGSGVDVFYALLAAAFPRRCDLPLERDARGLPYLDPANLTPNQGRALQAIGRSPVWRIEPFYYGRLMDLGLEYGLPWHPQPFADYLANGTLAREACSDA